MGKLGAVKEIGMEAGEAHTCNIVTDERAF